MTTKLSAFIGEVLLTPPKVPEEARGAREAEIPS